MQRIERDVAIVGAGPSGLFMAFEAGFLGYTSAVLDAQAVIGGQLATLYPDKPIYDVPGCPGILAGQLVKNLEVQVAPFAPHYMLGCGVTALRGAAGAWELATTTGEVVACKVVVIAGGSGMFAPRKPTGVVGLEAWEAVGAVRYAVSNKADYAGQQVVLAGGGDSAVDWVVELAEVAAHVHVVHRRAEFRAAEATVAKMRALEAAGKVTIHTPYELAELRGQNGNLSTVVLKDGDGGTREIGASKVVCCFGLLPNPGPLAGWGLGLEKGLIPTDRVTQQTARPGVLCIGDMAHYDGKVSLIVTGFAEAAVASKTVQAIIHPEKKWKVQYSTSKGVGAAV